MAIDFPNSPTVNQVFTAPNGATWMWDGAKWGAITSTSPYAGNTNVGRNLLHNPLFNINQRGYGSFTVAGAYTSDRWTSYNANGTQTTSVVAVTDADRAAIGDEAAIVALQAVITGSATAGSSNMFTQSVEDVRRTGNKTVTVSFWAKAATGTPRLGVGFQQNFGTGGSPSATVNAAGQSVVISTTFARYSVTIALSSIAGKTYGSNNDSKLTLILWLSGSSDANAQSGSVGVQSGTFSVWGVQLEIGSVATPLEKPDPQQDLANCQRFYQTGSLFFGSYNTAGQNISAQFVFPVQMRASPTVVLIAGSNANIGTLNVPTTPGSVLAYTAVTATGSASVNQPFNASADL